MSAATLKKFMDSGPIRDFIKKQVKNKTAILVDGPNILIAKEIDLAEIGKSIKTVSVKKCYLTKEVPDGLVKAVINCGFSPIPCYSNIYVLMAMEAMDLVHSEIVERIVFVSRNSELAPVVRNVRDKGLEAVVFGFEPGMSVALRNAATSTYLFVVEPYCPPVSSQSR